MHAHAVGDVDRLVRVIHAHVNVHAEDQLLPRNELEPGDEVAVSRPRHDPLVLPHREGMRARRADRETEALRGVLHPLAQLAKLDAGLARVPARLRRDLADRLHQLGLDGVRLAQRVEERFDRIRELERLRVHDHQLFLDADRVGGARESVLHARIVDCPADTD